MTASAVERPAIAGPAGALEAVVEMPTGTTRGGDDDPVRAAEPGPPAPPCYAVICHPHPLLGGTMDNKVVTSVARAMHEEGIPTVRFNFRGVGGSAGTYDAGIGETADARAVADWGAVRWPGRRLVIAGFSFGAYVAVRLAQDTQALQLVTVAPPVGRFDFSTLAAPRCPWLVVQGDADDVVDPQSVIAWVGGLRPPPTLSIMPGVGHFFHGRLLELRETVRSAISETFRGGWQA